VRLIHVSLIAVLAFLCFLTSAQGQPAADAIHAKALALARSGDLEGAKRVLVDGQAAYPGDKRFPIDLAGVSYRLGNRSAAREHIRRALRLDPEDAYANNLLATLYMLGGNLDAAVKYWNRLSKPRVTRVRIPDDPGVDPGLLRKVLPKASSPFLTMDALRGARMDLERLEVFNRYRLELVPVEKEEFELHFDGWNRRELSTHPALRLLPFVRGLPYQAVHIDFMNLRASGANFTSMWRWDPDKRRAVLFLRGVLPTDPNWKLGIGADLRDEIWDLRNGDSPFSMRRNDLRIEASRRITSRLVWTNDLSYTRRRFRDAELTGGASIKNAAGFSYVLADLPEHGFTLRTRATGELGRFLGHSTFGKLQADLAADWGLSNWHVAGRMLGGTIKGFVPFDELFVIGMERDHNLWLRGHVATHEGRKGAAPIVSRYLLFQSEADRVLYRHTAFQFRVGPFVDFGRAGKWLVDAGIQSKINVLSGVTVTFVYGRNLREGGSVFYTAVEPRTR
jgi:hypothetical protein